jgi:hypothetical protein
VESVGGGSQDDPEGRGMMHRHYRHRSQPALPMTLFDKISLVLMVVAVVVAVIGIVVFVIYGLLTGRM